MRTSKHSFSDTITIDNSWQNEYMRRYYLSIPGWRNGTKEFHLLCKENIAESGKVLEIGSGPSNATSRFLGGMAELHGVDIDPDVKTNSALVSAHVVEDNRFPFSDATFDACVSNYVLEHVADVGRHLGEVQRVLKPNGVYIFRTPNVYHYTAIAARFTPYWFHKLVANALRNIPEDGHDPYPTIYKMNSRSAIRKYAAQLNMSIEKMRMVEKQPSYGMSSRMLFKLFMIYERLVNGSEKLSGMRANIFCVLRKK